jgi:hypothetical protein
MISKFDRRGNQSECGSNDQPSSPFFRVYEEVVFSGVYRVFHSAHRVSHDVILRAGEIFPRCKKCGEDVHFELVQPVSRIRSDPDFNIRLYEIPHREMLDEQDEEQAEEKEEKKVASFARQNASCDRPEV